MLDWLERNVHVVLDRVDEGDLFVAECEEKRKRRYQKTPRNVLRHIILSDIKEVTAAVADVSFIFFTSSIEILIILSVSPALSKAIFYLKVFNNG
jgi:hypothetical protein